MSEPWNLGVSPIVPRNKTKNTGLHRSASDLAMFQNNFKGGTAAFSLKGTDTEESEPLQDSYLIHNGKNCSLYGMFDGHGLHGSDMANKAKTHFQTFIENFIPQSHEKISQELEECFSSLEKLLLKDPNSQESGTTATVCIIYNNIIHCCWVGDSLASVAKKDTIAAGLLRGSKLMDVHRLSNDNERNRLSSLEGISIDGFYVSAQEGFQELSITRSLGDSKWKKMYPNAILSQPDYTATSIPSDAFMFVLATNGLWDCCTEGKVMQKFSEIYVNRTVEENGGDKDEVAKMIISDFTDALKARDIPSVLGDIAAEDTTVLVVLL